LEDFLLKTQYVLDAFKGQPGDLVKVTTLFPWEIMLLLLRTKPVMVMVIVVTMWVKYFNLDFDLKVLMWPKNQ
jgi:hypothetical protein